MTPAIILFVIGGVLLISGFKNQSLGAILRGEKDTLPEGNVPDYEQGIADNTVAGPPIPEGLHNGLPSLSYMDGHPVAGWIAHILRWAKAHGWQGKVTSGYRAPWVKITPSPGLPVAPQGQSNHNSLAYPGGAVDVSNPEQLESVLARYPDSPTLVRGTAIGDPIHFSATGR